MRGQVVVGESGALSPHYEVSNCGVAREFHGIPPGVPDPENIESKAADGAAMGYDADSSPGVALGELGHGCLHPSGRFR